MSGDATVKVMNVTFNFWILFNPTTCLIFAKKSTPLPVMTNIRCAREAGCNEGREELMGEVLIWRKLDESQFSNNRDHFCGKLVCERLINNNKHSFPFRYSINSIHFYRTQVRSLSVTKGRFQIIKMEI